MFDQSKETMTTLEPKQKPENSKRPLKEEAEVLAIQWMREIEKEEENE